MYSFRFLLVTLLIMITACATKRQEENAVGIYAGSMKVHDEIMPRMDEMYKLRQALVKVMDSIRRQPVYIPGEKETEAIEALARLAEADEAMMDWMHQIKDVPGSGQSKGHHHDPGTQNVTLTDEQILQEQLDQRAAIDTIRRKIEESIGRARTVLGKK